MIDKTVRGHPGPAPPGAHRHEAGGEGRDTRSCTVTKSGLIDAVAEGAGLTGRNAADVVNAVFSAMEDALVRGDRIEIRGFGSFRVKHYAAYTGRNPRTGDHVAVRAKVAPVFKVGRELRHRLMNGADDE